MNKNIEKNDELFSLARKLDEISYNFDTYDYHDQVGHYSTEKDENIKQIYNDLINDNTEQYITSLKEMIEEGIDDIEVVKEVLENLESLNVSFEKDYNDIEL